VEIIGNRQGHLTRRRYRERVDESTHPRTYLGSESPGPRVQNIEVPGVNLTFSSTLAFVTGAAAAGTTMAEMSVRETKAATNIFIEFGDPFSVAA
jgi:hypothetical protein